MYHIIVNPAAGNGRGFRTGENLDKFLKSCGRNCEILYTKKPFDAADLAAQACSLESDGIIAVGGDGTSQEVISGMLPFILKRVSPPFGILPSGSGNDFVMSLERGNGKIQSFEETAAKYLFGLLENKTRPIDIIRINDTAYLNIASIGLDARIAKYAVSLKKFFKKKAYLVSTVKSILGHNNMTMRIEINGEKSEDIYTLIAVCNGQYYGGGLRISPQAKIDDGIITVCLIKGASRFKLLGLFPTILLEKHVKLREVSYINCTKMTIYTGSLQSLSLDGNLYDFPEKLEFEIMPGAVQLFCQRS